ncbi:MAG: Acetyltransferase (GNAT) family protein [Candidatus Woesebacteria bacterium GW2011_GWB1_38_5b]|uniref:Acetyltransferase (GNAT) family protein n=1 Tax=Candidatus Woesebacteria bacterium GW2011_GWB1_38_5b TaxID=1618569 RepID=A0A0G0MKX9_9BACT|nr:MAG: Acetyltransferase (GNAT) family protein [Candidatus Woesebacteria bacterium GW2011_GWB1_38_5b]
MDRQKDILQNHTIEISELKESDIEQVKPILETHVRDRNTHEILPGEISEIQSYMRGGKDNYGRIRKYLVARDETGKVWGCMAYSSPDPDMVKHFDIKESEKTAELLNAFVSPEVFRGGGIGKKLFETICNNAKANEKNLLVIHSGPRYKASWGFYDKMCGGNQGMIIEKYGKGGDAMTWKKVLN